MTKHRPLINNWIRDSPITGVGTDLQSQSVGAAKPDADADGHRAAERDL